MSPKDVIHIKRKAMTQPQLNRRGFIGAFLGAAVIDPERLLFVPGRKMISIPAPRAALTPLEIEQCRKIIDGLVAYHYDRIFSDLMRNGCATGFGFLRIQDLAA